MRREEEEEASFCYGVAVAGMAGAAMLTTTTRGRRGQRKVKTTTKYVCFFQVH